MAVRRGHSSPPSRPSAYWHFTCWSRRTPSNRAKCSPGFSWSLTAHQIQCTSAERRIGDIRPLLEYQLKSTSPVTLAAVTGIGFPLGLGDRSNESRSSAPCLNARKPLPSPRCPSKLPLAQAATRLRRTWWHSPRSMSVAAEGIPAVPFGSKRRAATPSGDSPPNTSLERTRER